MRWLKIHIPILCAGICYFAVLQMLDATCLILHFTGFICPTCGVTRALVSLAHGDLQGYVAYHPLALFLLLAVLWLCHRRFMRKKWPGDILAYAILVLNFVFYIIRLCLM